MTHAIRRSADPEVPELERVTLVSDAGLEAAFVPGGGLIGTSLRFDGVEVLARRKGMAAYVGRGSTHGIPLLAPWANRLSQVEQHLDGLTWDVRPGDPGVVLDDFGQAIHGLLAGAPEWESVEAVADAGSARLTARFRFDDRLERFVRFPFAHDLDVAIELRDLTLRISTTLTPTSDVPVPVAFGWHPWLQFAGSPRAEWSVEGPLHRRALLGPTNIPTGEVVEDPLQPGPLGDRFLDDVFVDVADGTEVVARGRDRTVRFRYLQGYDVAVVYAPHAEDVLCVEQMTAPTDPFRGWWPLRRAEPGSPYTAVFEMVLSH